jgi:predicted ATPase
MVTRVKIKNFRGIDDLDLELGPLNVLIGPNASGKSNFIEVFEFLKHCEMKSVHDAIRQAGGGLAIKNFGSGADEPIELEVHLQEGILAESRDSSQRKAEMRISLLIDPENNTPNIIGEYCRWLDGPNTYITRHDGPDSLGFLRVQESFNGDSGGFVQTNDQEYPLLNKRLPKFPGEAYNVRHALLDAGFKERPDWELRDTIAEHLETNAIIRSHDLVGWHLKPMYRAPDDWGKSGRLPVSSDLPSFLHYLKATGGSDQNSLRDLEEWASLMILDFDRFDISKNRLGEIAVGIKWRSSDRAIPLDRVSDGTISMILLGVYLKTIPAIKRVDGSFHLFLDEPETSLHPTAQHLLAEAIQEAVADGLQVTLTTHNPYFVDFFPAKSLIAFEAPGPGMSGKRRFRNIKDDAYAMAWLREFKEPTSEAWRSGVLGALQ